VIQSKHNLIAKHHWGEIAHGVVSIMFAIALCFWRRVKGQKNLQDVRNIIKVGVCSLSHLSLSQSPLFLTGSTLTMGCIGFQIWNAAKAAKWSRQWLK
jgi:hypothetical protein